MKCTVVTHGEAVRMSRSTGSRCAQISASNYMCMNNNKTEYLPVIPKTAAATALVDGSVIRVGNATITASRFVRDLGVVTDRHLDFKKQVSRIVSVC